MERSVQSHFGLQLVHVHVILFSAGTAVDIVQLPDLVRKRRKEENPFKDEFVRALGTRLTSSGIQRPVVHKRTDSLCRLPGSIVGISVDDDRQLTLTYVMPVEAASIFDNPFLSGGIAVFSL